MPSDFDIFTAELVLGIIAALALFTFWREPGLRADIAAWFRGLLPPETRDLDEDVSVPYVMGHHEIHIPTVKPLDRSNFEASYRATVVPFTTSRRRAS